MRANITSRMAEANQETDSSQGSRSRGFRQMLAMGREPTAAGVLTGAAPQETLASRFASSWRAKLSGVGGDSPRSPTPAARASVSAGAARLNSMQTPITRNESMQVHNSNTALKWYVDSEVVRHPWDYITAWHLAYAVC